LSVRSCGRSHIYTREGNRVIIIGLGPEIETSFPEALAKVERVGSSKNLGPTFARFRDRQEFVFRAFAAVTGLPGGSVIYPSSILCDTICAVEHAGRPLYIDDNHVSLPGL
jgi:hypothetical protein